MRKLYGDIATTPTIITNITYNNNVEECAQWQVCVSNNKLQWIKS